MIMSHLIRFSLLCCLTLLGLTANAKTAPTFIVETAVSRLEIAPWLDKLPAHLSNVSSAELLAQADHWPWQALDQPVLAQGRLSNGIWLRLKIRNDGLEQRRTLEFIRANLSHIEILSRQRNGSWQVRNAGTAELSPRGDTTGLGYSFALSIPEGSSTTYIHLQSTYPLATPIHISSENGLLRALQNNAGFFGVGLGLLGGMVLGMAGLRSARISLSLRWAFLSVIVMAMTQAMVERGVLGYWWLDIPNALHCFTQLSSCMLSMAHLLLCYQFLAHQKSLTANVQRLLHTIILANLIWMLISVAWLPDQWSPASDVIRWLSYTTVMVALWQPTQRVLKGAALYRGIMAVGLLSQLLSDASLRGYVPFVAEPYQILMIWHLLTMPILLYVLEQPETPPAVNAMLPSVHNTPWPGSPSYTLPTAPSADVTRILIVEDNPWVQQVLAGLLLKLNCQTCLAADGQEALQRLASEVFDLVLMDCDLPGLDGFSTTQLWRSQTLQTAGAASAPQVPIIAVTAHISASHRQQAREAGMNDFLQKPIDMRTLHDVLTRWLPQYASKA